MKNDPLKQLLKERMPIYCSGCHCYLGQVKRSNYKVEVVDLRVNYHGVCPQCGHELASKVRKGIFGFTLSFLSRVKR